MTCKEKSLNKLTASAKSFDRNLVYTINSQMSAIFGEGSSGSFNSGAQKSLEGSNKTPF